MNPVTQNSMQILLSRSFNEMLDLLHLNHDLNVRSVTPDVVEAEHLRSVMFTLSCAEFRVILLLHFQSDPDLVDTIYEFLKIDKENGVQQKYHDYVCELGNNCCGAACRILGSADYSTGMSTPVVLENFGSTEHIRSEKPDFHCHIGSFLGEGAVFFSSFCLFINDGLTETLEVKIPEACNESEGAGELEFF